MSTDFGIFFLGFIIGGITGSIAAAWAIARRGTTFDFLSRDEAEGNAAKDQSYKRPDPSLDDQISDSYKHLEP